MSLFKWIGCLLLVSPSLYADQPRSTVEWGCQLDPGSNANCLDIKSAYFEIYSTLAVEWDHKEGTQPAFSITLGSTPSGDGKTIYTSHFLGTGTLPEVKHELTILNSKPSSEAQTLILEMLRKDSAPFFTLLSSEGTTLKFGLNDGKISRLKKEKGGILSSSSINGNMKTGTNDELNLNAYQSLKYSSPDMLLKSGAFMEYGKISGEIDGVRQTADVLAYGMDVVTAYSISGKWSVAALGSYYHSAVDNLDQAYDAGVGIEWNLVPFMRVNESTVAIRYFANYENQKGFYPNVNDRMNEDFFTHTLKTYLNWHFEKLDLTSTFSAHSIVDRVKYSKLSTSLGAQYEISNNLRASVQFNLTWRPGSINEPLTPPIWKNDIEGWIRAGNFTGFQTSTRVGLTIIFGPAYKYSQDRRWN